MERTASANGVTPRNTGKETRAAMVAHCGGGTFVHLAALFPPTAQELQTRRHRGSLIVAEQPECGGGEEHDDLALDGEDLDGADADGSGAGEDVPPDGAMPPPVTTTAGQQPAA